MQEDLAWKIPGPTSAKPRPTRVGFSHKTLRPDTRYKVTHVTRSTLRPNYTHANDLQDLDNQTFN